MEVGIPQTLSSLEKSFLPTSRLSLESNVLDVKLTDKDDEGEIMLLAMILLQLNGVKLPSSSSSSSSSSASVSDDESDLLNKKKRQRTSPDQLAILEQIFQTDKMPNQQTRVQLADQLGMSSRRVQIWFQNKRAKVKRSSTKDGEGECSSPSSLGDSSSSLTAPDSPSSSSESIPSPCPQSPITLSKVPDTPSIISAATLTSVVSSLTSKSFNSSSIDTTLADTAKQLKAQQLQFSLKAPFAETQTQPLMTY